MFRHALIAIGLMCASLANPAKAAVTISFAGGNSATNGSAGNIGVYSSGSVSVQASAWSLSGWTLTPAWLGQYANGLGVTNLGEDGISSNSSAIDNVNGNDFVLLIFNQPVSLVSALLTPVQVSTSAPDNDATTSYATLAGAFTSPVPTPVSSSSPVWLNLLFASSSVQGNTIAPYSTALTLGNAYGNVWLLGADMSGLDQTPDGFRLTSINVNASPVPEGSTWVMMLLGLCAIARLIIVQPSGRRLFQIA